MLDRGIHARSSVIPAKSVVFAGISTTCGGGEHPCAWTRARAGTSCFDASGCAGGTWKTRISKGLVMMMVAPLGIVGIAYELGAQYDAYEDWALPAGRDPGFVQTMKACGLQRYARARNATPLELAGAAVDKLFAETGVSPQSIDLVVCFHSLHTSVPVPPASQIDYLRRKFALGHVSGFTVSQQRCVSFIFILHLLQHILTVRRDIHTVLVTGADVALFEAERNVDAIAMESDGAVAVLVRREHPHNRVLGTGTITQGQYYDNREFKTDDPDFTMRYALSSGLTMRRLVAKVLATAGVDAASIKRVLPHNGNPVFWAGLARHFDWSADVSFTRNIGAVGHVYGADSLINAKMCLDEGTLRAGDYYLLGSVAFGRSYGCAVIQC